MADPFIEFRFEKDAVLLFRKAEKAFGRESAVRAILNFFDRQAIKISGRIAREFLSGQRLNRRTGTLARSITGLGKLINGAPALQVGIFRGPALQYAAVQEFGTKGKDPASPIPTIKPRKAKALAIPQKPALTAAGVDRYGGPRGYPGTLRFIPFRSSGVAVGGLFDADSLDAAKTGASDKRPNLRDAIMVYLLVKQVDIEGKHYLRDGFTRALPKLAQDLAVFLSNFISLRQG